MATPIGVPLVTITEGVRVSETVLGKRCRERHVVHYNRSTEPDDHDSSSIESPQKRGKPTTDGVLEAARSAKRTRRTPAIRTQQNNNGKSKAVGRGAGRLAATTAQELYHRSLSGPSVPQGSMGALGQGKSPWTEEREEEMRRDKGSNLPQQVEEQNPAIAENLEGQAIPKTLTAWQRL